MLAAFLLLAVFVRGVGVIPEGWGRPKGDAALLLQRIGSTASDLSASQWAGLVGGCPENPQSPNW